MSRYIEEDHLIANLYVQSDDDGYICCPVNELEEMIKAEPTADVREVVRCKDCKFYPGGYFSDDRIMIETYMHCPNFKDDGFCSYGRRKEE